MAKECRGTLFIGKAWGQRKHENMKNKSYQSIVHCKSNTEGQLWFYSIWFVPDVGRRFRGLLSPIHKSEASPRMNPLLKVLFHFVSQSLLMATTYRRSLDRFPSQWTGKGQREVQGLLKKASRTFSLSHTQPSEKGERMSFALYYFAFFSFA